MSKFNTQKITSPTERRVSPVIINQSGGKAYDLSPKFKLALQVITTFLKDDFYRSANDTAKAIKQAAHAVRDPKFVAKLAIYARREHGIRSATHLLAGEVIQAARGEKWLGSFLKKVVFRVDDMLEIAAYYLSTYSKKEKGKDSNKYIYRPVPNSLKRAFKSLFDTNRFDGYQLAKYKKEGSEFALRDLVNLVHAKPNKPLNYDSMTEEGKAKWNPHPLTRLMQGTLKNTETVEATLSATEAGSEERGEALLTSLKKNKLGYFAVLKNLRNILNTSNTEAIDLACLKIKDENAILNSKVMSFRYDVAFQELDGLSGVAARKMRDALEDAIEISLRNIPDFGGNTLVVVDESGSMTNASWHTNNPDSKIPIRIASLFAAAIYKQLPNADLMMYDTTARFYTPSKRAPILTIAQELVRAAHGGGTRLSTVFDLLSTSRKAYDRIIILTDEQSWGGGEESSLKRYRDTCGKHTHLFHFDVVSYGNTTFKENEIYLMGGVSDKSLNLMGMLETDRNALIRVIESIEL